MSRLSSAIPPISFLSIWLFLFLFPAVGMADESDADEPVDLLQAEEQEEIPAVQFGELEPGLEEASTLLEENFHSFLKRHPLGFDSQLSDLLAEDTTRVYEVGHTVLTNPTALGPERWFEIVLIWAVIAFFFVLFFLIDRHATRLGHRIQARLHFDVSPWLTSAVRKLVLILARSVAFFVLIGLSFFPIRALFGVSGWTLLLTDCLVIFLVYRAIKTALLSALRLNPRNEDVQRHYRRLERFLMIALRVIIVFVVVMAAIERFEYHDQAAAFVSFLFRLTLVVLPVYLYWMRESVLALMPPQPEARLYRALRKALNRNYFIVLTATIVLMGFNAAGYREAATFFLTRGYALIVIAVLWFAFLERLHHHVTTRLEQADETDEATGPSPLLKAVEHWMIAIGSLVIVVLTLRLLGLYAPIVALLQTPLLAVGHLEVSLYSLLNVILIVTATVLSVRLFKALLNAKIYPALEVEVGVAYAINTLLNYALVVVAFILCLVALGVRLSAVMVVMASLGVGIGFGLQNIAENLISGFILLFGRAVKKGDFITVNDLYGRVEAVGARSVVVRTPDNFSMLIPSKEIVSGRIVNWTFHDSTVRVHIPIGVSYDSDPGEVRQVLLDAATRHPDILDDPPPDVWIVEFGDNSIQFELLVYFNCRVTNERTLKGKFNFIVWEALQDSDIEIPYPQRDLHLRSIGDLESLPDPDESDPPRRPESDTDGETAD